MGGLKIGKKTKEKTEKIKDITFPVYEIKSEQKLWKTKQSFQKLFLESLG